jgi:hypothetical protein
VWSETVWVTVGEARLQIPAALAVASGTAIDSASAVFEGGGMTVIVDQGPFADRLESYVGESGYEEQTTPLAGTEARVIRFIRPDGTFTVGARITKPKQLTVVVHGNDVVPEQVARDVITSLRIIS